MMSSKPVITKEYLYQVLHLCPVQTIEDIIIISVAESNTALTIRFEVLLRTAGHSDVWCRLFAKTVKPGNNENVYHSVSLKEAEFYKMIQNQKIVNLPIVRCFDVYISSDKSKYFILLQDVADKYIGAGKLDLAAKSVWLSASECLARFHASFWNLHKICSAELQSMSAETVDVAVNETYRSYERFKAYVGDRFDCATYAIYDHAVDINVSLLKENYKRMLNHRNITMVHGDSHIFNFMFSIDQNCNPLLLDFQFWNVGIGVGDLAHLTRESFPQEFCSSLHKPIIEKYHNTLYRLGVQDYSSEDCWNDYRKQVATMLLIPMWQYTVFGLEYENWENDIQSLKLNYNSLACDQIML